MYTMYIIYDHNHLICLYVCIALMQQYGYVKLYQYEAKRCENMQKYYLLISSASFDIDVKHLAPTSLQHFVSEQSSAESEHCPGVVDAEVVEVDPEVEEVVASAQVGTSNTQVELVVLASIGHHNVTMDSETFETQQTMIKKSRWKKKTHSKI